MKGLSLRIRLMHAVGIGAAAYVCGVIQCCSIALHAHYVKKAIYACWRDMLSHNT